MKRILVVGATGATGRLLVENLLGRDQKVRAIIRSPEKLSQEIKDHKNLELINASLLDLTEAEMVQYTEGCYAIASCLGHNLSFRGIFGPPWRLVTDAVRRLSEAVMSNQPKEPVKFILMNTTGNTNRDIPEKRSIGEKIIIGIIRLLLPPQADNEKAAEYLRTEIGHDNKQIEWVVVRPDALINEDSVSEYEVHPSPIRSAIFDPGKTSRINVGEFMSELIVNDQLWNKWKGQMPVIYNVEEPNTSSD